MSRAALKDFLLGHSLSVSSIAASAQALITSPEHKAIPKVDTPDEMTACQATVPVPSGYCAAIPPHQMLEYNWASTS